MYLYGDMTIKVMGPDVEVSAVAFHGVTGSLFFGPCTQVHGQGSPAIRAGKGWRGRRELAPRCSATRISCISGAWQDRLPRVLIICTTHHTPHTTHTPHHNTPQHPQHPQHHNTTPHHNTTTTPQHTHTTSQNTTKHHKTPHHTTRHHTTPHNTQQQHWIRRVGH